MLGDTSWKENQGDRVASRLEVIANPLRTLIVWRGDGESQMKRLRCAFTDEVG
jgi:hypothetical protein